MPKAPILLDVRVKQQTQRATIANLRQYGRTSIAALQRVTARSGARAQAAAFRFAPVDTEYMRTHIHLVLSAQRMAYQIGYDESDFTGTGRPPYYIFQELGFRHWLSGAFIQNAHLRPAFEQEHPRYLREVAQALRTSAQRMAV